MSFFLFERQNTEDYCKRDKSKENFYFIFFIKYGFGKQVSYLDVLFYNVNYTHTPNVHI